jgi:dTDP-4-dehydrorhamnose reductase
MKILVLGNTGMLGQTVHTFLSGKNYNVYSTSRRQLIEKSKQNSIRFDVAQDDISSLRLKEENYDYIVNCIGIIRHQITETRKSTINAIRVNSQFPLELLEEIEGSSTKLIQIGTDCVFSGRDGSYTEDSIKDPVDSYGYSKAMGELFSRNQMILRCSIIGLENENYLSLMEWFLRQPLNARVNGYIDHKWNGLTTLAFAKVLSGVISGDAFEAGTFHLVPDGQVSKFQLLQTLASTFRRVDLDIQPVEASSPIDRTLATKFAHKNAQFWESAEYGQIPTIKDMLSEYETFTREKPSK